MKILAAVLILLAVPAAAAADCTYRVRAAGERTIRHGPSTIIIERGIEGIVTESHYIRGRVWFTVMWSAGLELGICQAPVCVNGLAKDVVEINVARSQTVGADCQ